MLIRTIVWIGMTAFVACTGAHAQAAPVIHNQAQDIVGAGGAADPLIAVEVSREAIVDRLVAEYANALGRHGISAEGFRAALVALRADQLLAASLVNTLEQVSAIVGVPASNGALLQRFVAMTPSVPTSMNELPPADAYLVRSADTLVIVKSSAFPFGKGQVVGYFVPATNTSVTTVATHLEKPEVKDGPGTGANSWIGFTAGNNQASGAGSAVAAGKFNSASGANSFVGAGQSNSADGISSLVIGGFDNHATVIDATVVAGAGNRATGARSVVVGGGFNLASGQWSFVGGGGRQTTNSGAAGTFSEDNVASGDFSTIAGGQANEATGHHSTISGGRNNIAFFEGATIAGGGNTGTIAAGATCPGSCANQILNNYGTISGGAGNIIPGAFSTIGGGSNNTASGTQSTIGGGVENTTSASTSTVSGGFRNTASATESFVGGGFTNVASGIGATVAGGQFNIASGLTSFAAGLRAKTQTAGASPTIHNGVFIFADSNNFDFNSSAANEFAVRATGGARIVSGINVSTGAVTAGVGLAAGGGSWSSLSDRNAKFNFSAVDHKAILAKVAALDVSLWSYNAQGESVRHIGPMAQDFSAAFGVGENDTTIATVDADGVALAAIQGLHEIVQEKDTIIRRQQIAIERLEARMTDIDVLRAEIVMMKSALAEMKQERLSVARHD